MKELRIVNPMLQIKKAGAHRIFLGTGHIKLNASSQGHKQNGPVPPKHFLMKSELPDSKQSFCPAILESLALTDWRNSKDVRLHKTHQFSSNC